MVSSKPYVNPAKSVLFPSAVEENCASVSLGKLVRAQPELTSRASLHCEPGTAVGASEGAWEDAERRACACVRVMGGGGGVAGGEGCRHFPAALAKAAVRLGGTTSQIREKPRVPP